MRLNMTSNYYGKDHSFNMTPVIDIVFLLIVFFLVVCQFIEAENFPVEVPDKCNFAENHSEQKTAMNTVTVVKTDDGKIDFAIGSEKITASSRSDLVEELVSRINERLEDLNPEQRAVILRIDKDICFADAQYALAAVALSSATDVQLAALKNKQPVSP